MLHLLGNHEADFLADPNNHKSAALRKELASKGVLSSRDALGAFGLMFGHQPDAGFFTQPAQMTKDPFPISESLSRTAPCTP